MLIKCPECGHQVSDQAKTCPSCGIEIAGKITRCPDCGEIIFKEQSSCPNCRCSINGASLPPQESVPPFAPVPAKSKQAAPEPEVVPAPRRPRKKKLGLVAIVVAFVIALIVVFLGIYFMKTQEQKNEMRAFQNAMMSSEPLVLQNYLDMYADAPRAHRDSITTHLTALMKVDSDWRDALVNNNKHSYERYMKRYPESDHCVEAKIKIDSLDWEEAKKADTAEAYQKYFNAHSDGAYYDEAHTKYEKLEAQKITSEDRQVITQLFVTYFNAIAQMDEAALSATLAPVLTSFLHRPNATRTDVLQYMLKLHENDITKMEFTPNGDWSIEKQDLGEGRFSFGVKFTVAQHMERTDEGRETSVVYKVTAQVSPEGRISELNMKRSVQ